MGCLLDVEFSEGSFDRSVSARNFARMRAADAAGRCFVEISARWRREGWARDEHFIADSTLMESWAGRKSFVRKDGVSVPGLRGRTTRTAS